MRILLASSEVHPYSKTGGLADAAGALGKALAKAGHDVAVVTPLYRGVQQKFPALERLDRTLEITLGDKRVGGEVWAHRAGDRLTVYFIRHDHYFDRAGIYNEQGVDYWDNGERFIYFSKAVVQLARDLPLSPEVVHVADWQTGLVPLMLAHTARVENWAHTPRTCFTIHNLAYQGVFPGTTYGLANLPNDYFIGDGAEQFGRLNCLKAGIAHADVVTTVSPRYAREITTQEFGVGLDSLLRKRQGQGTLIGILNGVDYDEWNTTRNRFLAAPYSIDDLSGKAVNKSALQGELALTVHNEVPVFATITRLTEQKGVDIELGALEEMLAGDVQFVLLGSGSREHEFAFERLSKRYPGKVAVRIGYNHRLSHLIEAGADFYLMPSRFEPCGLNQMYSLRFGTIPIVRRTGGLDDSVVDAIDDADRANGIKFESYSATALAKAMRKALVIFGNPAVHHHYQQNGMTADFSWEKVVGDYVAAYEGKFTP